MPQDRTATRPFGSEVELVDAFVAAVQTVGSPWATVALMTEFSYQRGRPDVVVVDERGSVVAFEAKLLDWRHALHQAYRNTCFAHRSYVVLPEEVAYHASQFSGEFLARGIGLCAVGAHGLAILCDALEEVPLQPWLAERAIEVASAASR